MKFHSPRSPHLYSEGGVACTSEGQAYSYVQVSILVKRQCYSLSMDWKNDTFIGAFIKLLIQVLTTAMVESQTSLSKGSKNTNRLTSSFSGFCINKLTLKSIKGLLKSTSSSLAAEIVMAPMAMWAFWKWTQNLRPYSEQDCVNEGKCETSLCTCNPSCLSLNHFLW